jgi:hypothetical protein
VELLHEWGHSGPTIFPCCKQQRAHRGLSFRVLSQAMCSRWEGWLSPVEGTRLESEKAGFSEVCTILRIVSGVAPVNDLRAIEFFKSFRRFGPVFTKIGADRRNGSYKCSPQSEALDSLAECLIVQRKMSRYPNA